MNVARILFLLVAFALLGACATVSQAPHPDLSYAPTLPNEAAFERPAPDGAIYHDAQNLELFSDPRAHRIGDILTIELVENTQASKKASTKTSKTNKDDIATPTLFGKPTTIAGNPLSFGIPDVIPETQAPSVNSSSVYVFALPGR